MKKKLTIFFVLIIAITVAITLFGFPILADKYNLNITQTTLLAIVLVAIVSIIVTGLFEYIFESSLTSLAEDIDSTWNKTNSIENMNKNQHSIELHPIITVIQNITKDSTNRIKELESKGGYSDSFNRLITTVSHQLRTPVTGLKWAINSIVDGVNNNNAIDKELLIGAKDATERIGSIVETMLIGVRHEYSVTKNQKPTDPEYIINKIIAESSLIAKQRNVHVVVVKNVPQIPLIDVDDQEVGFVIHSILSNAIFYSDESGKVTISISAQNNNVNISIHNNGKHIPDTERALLFSQFSRGSEAIKMNPDGAGMSLYITKQIIVDAGGSITFESTQDEGTTFNIILPISKKAELETSIRF